MSLDLKTLFDEAGYDGPVRDVDCDYIVRRGRRARARRQALVGGTAILGAGVVALVGGTLVHDASGSVPGGSASSGRPATSSSVTATPSPSQPIGVAAQLQAVTLPDPAPGFPIRRFQDSAPRQTSLDGVSAPMYWVRSFLLAEKPGITTTDASGNVTGGRPTGPEVTMFVGTFPAEWSAAHAGGRPSSQAAVAGVVGDVYVSTEKGVPMLVLTFQRGPFSVFIQGSGGATVDQLVALGDALNGLPTASASPAPTTVPTTSPVITVSAGQKVDLGSGSYLTVTPTEKCYVLADPPNPSTPECKSLTDGNQAAKSISLQSGSAGAGKPTVMTGIYTGIDATLITVTSGGLTRAATIVKLGAHPNSLIYYLVWPTAVPAGADAHGGVTIEAFDGAGRSLAKLGG
jgi:hypothetical protein